MNVYINENAILCGSRQTWLHCLMVTTATAWRPKSQTYHTPARHRPRQQQFIRVWKVSLMRPWRTRNISVKDRYRPLCRIVL